jgi:hypothetical protein
MKIAHILSLGFVVTSAVVACSSNTPPCQGSVRCNCYPNSTCNAGLVCASNLCVVPPDGAAIIVEPDSGAVDEGGDETLATDDSAAPPAGDAPVGPAGPNLVTNGDFSQGQAGWDVVYGPGMAMVTSGELCVSGAGTLTILGWPEPSGTTGVALAAAAYTLSYSARVQGGNGNVAIEAKVGQTAPPNNADFDTTMDSASATSMTFSHTFTPPAADSSAGLAFSFSAPGASVCFKNVSLTQN